MTFDWIRELVNDGLRNLWRHKLRSCLTLLGVVFGVGAVIAMLGIGEGAQRTVLREIAAIGLKNIVIDSVQPESTSVQEDANGRPKVLKYGITFKDAAQIRGMDTNLVVAVGHLVNSKVYFRSKRLGGKTLGIAPEYMGLINGRLREGRNLSVLDEERGTRAVVLTRPVADNINVPGGAIGQSLNIGGHYMTVVGIVDVPDRQTTDWIFMPYRTAKNIFGTVNIKSEAGAIELTETEVGQVVVQVRHESDIPATAAAVRRILAASHKMSDYNLSVPLDLLKKKQRTQRILNGVLITIAAISLVVGGIGIMNIMLSIVTERIPEIGLRRAIGARRRDILFQFLAETVTLSTIGGLAGCLLGILAVPTASRWTGWPGIVTPGAVFLALTVSWLVGLVFGLAPAIRAARMDPVEALRYE
jgi:putative ABC transport system permease protein